MMKKKKVACVTGATGFIGNHLCRHLLTRGWDVHAITRESSSAEILQSLSKNGMKIHCYSSAHTLVEILEEAKPHVVFHLASAVWNTHTYDTIEELLQSNIIFGTKLLEAMVQSNCRNLVNTGTYWQNYNDEEFNPVNLYAASKEAFEKIIRYYQEAEGIKTITLKLFDTYGPEDRRKKLMYLLERAAIEEKELDMTQGEQKIDLVYISDIVKAYSKAAEYLLNEEYEKEGVYAVKSGRTLSLRKIVEIYEEVTGRKLRIAWGKLSYRKREVMIPWSKGNILPGWNVEVGLEEGIVKMMKCNKIPMGGGAR